MASEAVNEQNLRKLGLPRPPSTVLRHHCDSVQYRSHWDSMPPRGVELLVASLVHQLLGMRFDFDLTSCAGLAESTDEHRKKLQNWPSNLRYFSELLRCLVMQLKGHAVHFFIDGVYALEQRQAVVFEAVHKLTFQSLVRDCTRQAEQGVPNHERIFVKFYYMCPDPEGVLLAEADSEHIIRCSIPAS